MLEAEIDTLAVIDSGAFEELVEMHLAVSWGLLARPAIIVFVVVKDSAFSFEVSSESWCKEAPSVVELVGESFSSAIRGSISPGGCNVRESTVLWVGFCCSWKSKC